MGIALKASELTEDAPLLEIVPLSDIYADGVGKVEVLGTCVRIWFFTYQGNPRERIVVAKIVRPLAELPADMVRRWITQSNVGAEMH